MYTWAKLFGFMSFSDSFESVECIMMKDKGLELIAEKGSCSASSRFRGFFSGDSARTGRERFLNYPLC